ncbi:hypothetical protein [Thalassococcus sp. S3]|uniref:hypothetical protein n=1 Tax=Thalassococcus sp. S3 TaxID=2017482 RepID=UPI0010244181|nr:hypothetical protein [Thalassococcus sp. S3]QBF34264.1 hypothetical protein CFI11_24060 [Thalassococcus sp. S3]
MNAQPGSAPLPVPPAATRPGLVLIHDGIDPAVLHNAAAEAGDVALLPLNRAFLKALQQTWSALCGEGALQGHRTGIGSDDNPGHPWYGVTEMEPDHFVTGCNRILTRHLLPQAPTAWQLGLLDQPFWSEADAIGFADFILSICPDIRLVAAIAPVEEAAQRFAARNDWDLDVAKTTVLSLQDHARALFAAHPDHVRLLDLGSDQPLSQGLADILGEAS